MSGMRLVRSLPEFRGIGDREEDVGLRLLGKAAPTVSVIKVLSNKRISFCIQDIALDVSEVKLRSGWCSHD